MSARAVAGGLAGCCILCARGDGSQHIGDGGAALCCSAKEHTMSTPAQHQANIEPQKAKMKPTYWGYRALHTMKHQNTTSHQTARQHHCGKREMMLGVRFVITLLSEDSKDFQK